MNTRPKLPISLCMIVKNEADTLARCLKSVAGVADELIVVDTGSTDGTAEIARRFGADVVDYPWNGDFAAARNAGLRRAKGAWILVLDADEELDESGKAELLLCAAHPEYEAFFLRIHNHQGKDRTSPTITVNPIIRLFRNRPGHRFCGAIHEQIASVILEQKPGAAMHLSGVVVHHYGYAAEVVAKKDKIKRNIELLQNELNREPDNAFHHFNMAVEHMRIGDSRKALQHIRRSLETAQADSSFIHLLYKYEVRCLSALEAFPAALEACERGIALLPNYPDLHHAHGVLQLQLGNLAAAKKAFRKAIAIGDAPPGYHTEAGLGTYATLGLLARVCEETGARQEAAAFYGQAARRHPQRPWPLVARMIRAYKGSGRERDIARELQAIWSSGTGSGGGPVEADAPWTQAARLLIEEGCFAAAADWLEGASGMAGDPAEAMRGEQREMTQGLPVVQAGVTDDPQADLVAQLRTAGAADPALLLPGDAAALLEHPFWGDKAQDDPETTAKLQRARSLTATANAVLASLPPHSAYAPAADRVRLALPFSHSDL
ncbi:glycosyltransferase family 2 protein [Paenibacillus sp. NFR01]|uniref:tetratricopeptide repeat-containing glycosyltransferase family 2 protein n=1 Tax=Paenibacillus sp. NFR01 TaxID=1566279 RepID=UPI0008CF5DA9|nr:glycosyltransferase family 2 protein [Paenibacillus sp. NFR01]SEU20219.1 Glycosyltransferase involved in cell wall bisynthesis [Paenibacillus sp. NFR01]